jgi:hypothetical protein
MKKILSIISIVILLLGGLGTGASLIQEKPSRHTVILDEYDMVIIAPKMFYDALQPLLIHKNNVGIQTFLKTTEEIYTEYPGRDNAEQIKYFIKDTIEQFCIDYTLFIGGIDLVPIRKSAVTLNYNRQTFNEFRTDLYYADIYDVSGNFSSWDTNGDDLFGEYTITLDRTMEIESPDVVDCYPDVGIGRLPCQSIDEVNCVIDKIITYETETYGSAWFNKMILMGGDTFPRNNIIEGERSLDEYIVPKIEKHGFDFVRLYASQGTFTPESINQAITDGAGFVSCSTHGAPCAITTFPPKKLLPELFQIRYYTKHIDGMNNGYKLPIFFLECCATGWFSFNLFDLMGFLYNKPFLLLKNLFDRIDAKKYPCFAWSIVKKQSGGGIAAIAASQPAWNDYDFEGGYSEFGAFILHKYFVEAYGYGITLSDMMIHAQNSYIDSLSWDRVTIDEFNLIGDPSLKIGGYP